MTPNIPQNVVPRHNRRTKPSRLPRSIDWQRGSINSGTLTIIIGLVTILGVASLSIFYLGQVFNTAEQGTDIQELEEHLVELKERQRAIELEGAQLRSIESIEQRVQELNLVATNKVTYLAPTGGKVATID